jgi:hypothetical protein
MFSTAVYLPGFLVVEQGLQDARGCMPIPEWVGCMGHLGVNVLVIQDLPGFPQYFPAFCSGQF